MPHVKHCHGLCQFTKVCACSMIRAGQLCVQKTCLAICAHVPSSPSAPLFGLITVLSYGMVQDTDPHKQLCATVSYEIGSNLVAHKEDEREHMDGLLASQRHLTSNVRTLINSLDQLLVLSAPTFCSSQPNHVRTVVSRARLLQKQLDSVGVRMQRIQVHLQGCGAPAHAPAHQQRQLPRQQPQGQEPHVNQEPQ